MLLAILVRFQRTRRRVKYVTCWIAGLMVKQEVNCTRAAAEDDLKMLCNTRATAQMEHE